MNNFESEFRNDAAASVGFSFIKVYNLWHKKIKDNLKRIDLTHPQFIVLASLGYLSQKSNEINQVDISKQSDIDVMTVSTIIRNLEKSGLVIRKNSLLDSRAKCIVLSDSGQEKLSVALPIVEEVDHAFFDVLGPNKELFNNLLLDLTKDR